MADAILQQYPYLFHKYGLHLTNSTTPLPYTVTQKGTHLPAVCHFHIYDIDIYATFRPHIDLIIEEFSIIITYSIGTVKDIPNDITILHVPNKGYDVGPKLLAIDYLQTQNLSYDYMLFLHSKTDPIMRNKMYAPLIKTRKRICELKRILDISSNIVGIFPDWMEHVENVWKYNRIYHNELLSLLDVTDRAVVFAAGNCMILRKSVIDRIFTDKIKLFYNMLNSADSFDLNWFLFKHSLDTSTSLQDAYDLFRLVNIGNNIPVHKTRNSFPDGMIEHTFERIWINVINDMSKEYLVVSDREI